MPIGERMESIIVALITGGLALIGTIITVIVTSLASAKSFKNELNVALAKTDTRLDLLTDSVHEQTEIVKKVPVIEERVKSIDTRLQKVEGVVQYGGRTA